MRNALLISVIASMALLPVAVAEEAEPPKLTISEMGMATYKFEWPGVQDRTFFLRWTEDLENWLFYPAILHGEGDHWLQDTPTDDNDVPLPKFFVQVKFHDEATDHPASEDFDDDGISNADEVMLHGTDPLENSDTDADGLLDSWEIARFGDLVSQDAAGDPDGDGLLNADEFLLGLDPNSNEATSAGNTQFDYDDTNRLTGATGPAAPLSYTLDDEGNLTNQ